MVCKDFSGLSFSEHTVEAYVDDANGIEQGYSDMISFGIGDSYVALGDSITEGQGDDISGDDISNDSRNSGGGYPPILNDLLTVAKGYPHTIVNAGKGAETSSGGLNRIQKVLNDNPNSQFFLICYGSNDSFGSTPVRSGLDTNKNPLPPTNPDYPDTFLDYMQQIVDAVVAASKTPVLAKVPIALGACSTCTPYDDPDAEARNEIIQDYNIVIDYLMTQIGNGMAAPDFYNFFRSNQDQFSDNIHPDGLGYQSMADLWLSTLTP
jgi:lysophospholipase L1-like esterase